MLKPGALEAPDFSAFPPNTVTSFERTVCLACVVDVFTKLLGITPKKTLEEMKNYTPPVEELTSHTLVRPYFLAEDPAARCPYCDSPGRKHARIVAHCIEGGRATDSARRKLMGSLPESEFAIVEEKSTHDEAFFAWLERMSHHNPEEDGWIRTITRAFLERKLPRVNWQQVFADTYAVRRSVRLDEGWEVDRRRLFLAAPAYYEAMAVQYILSRSQMGGGLTFEGRLTLPELVTTLRISGYLRGCGIHAHHPADVLEALMHHLAGGDGGVKMYYVIDRRDFLATLKDLDIIAPRQPAAVAKKIVKKTTVKKAMAKKARAGKS